MDNNARVKIQVDDSRVKELRNNVGELYEKFARNAREQAKDIREVNRRIEEQIRLLETRNQKASETRRRELEAEFRAGGMSRAEYNRNLKDIEGSASYARGRVADLREMLSADQALPRQQDRARELFQKLAGDVPRGNVASEIDERIRQFERQGQTDIASRAYRLRTRYDQGFITRDQFSRESASLRTDRQENALLVRLLREIADNTKNEAKNSAEELVKRLGVSSRADAATWIERLEGKTTGSIEDVIRRQEAASILKSRFGGGGGDNTGNVSTIGTIGSMLSPRNILSTASQFAPSLLALAIGKMYWHGSERVSEVTTGARDLAAINNGMNLDDLWSMSLDRGKRGVNLGLSGGAFLAARLNYQRSTGRLISADEAIGNLAQQRALGIDDSQYNQMLALGRFNRGRSAQGAVSALERTAERRFGNLALLPELLSTYQGAVQNILNVRGDFNQDAVAGVINGLSVGTGAQGAQLNRMVSGLQSIGKTGNPLGNAMAYRVARMVNPDIDVWGASKLIEDPLSNTEFLKAYLQQIQKSSGGGSGAKFLAKALLPSLSFDDIDKLFGAKGDRDFEKIIGEVKTGGGQNYESRAGELTSNLEKFTADLELIKDEAIDLAKTTIEAIRTEIEARQKMAEKYEEMLDKADNIADKLVAGLNVANLMNPYSLQK